MSGDTAPSALDTLWQMVNQHRLPQALLVACVVSAGSRTRIVEGLPVAREGKG